MKNKKQTYSYSKGAKPFDWFKALSQPEDEINWSELYSKSMMWVSCACGNQCAVIPRNSDGEPLDEYLSQLGIDFNNAILFNNVDAALIILYAIEDRSAELIKEITHEAKV